jgi:hypothetical protein
MVSEGIHDIGDTISIQHVRRNNTGRLAAAGVDDESSSASVQSREPDSLAIAGNQLVRSNRQFECTERAEIMAHSHWEP